VLVSGPAAAAAAAEEEVVVGGEAVEEAAGEPGPGEAAGRPEPEDCRQRPVGPGNSPSRSRAWMSGAKRLPWKPPKGVDWVRAGDANGNAGRSPWDRPARWMYLWR